MEITKLQKRLATKSAQLAQSLEKIGELNDELSREKLQHAPKATVLEHLRSVAETCERPVKRVKVSQLCENSSSTSSTVAFLALLSEKDDFKPCRKALALKNQCIHGLAAEAKDSWMKFADREKTNATAKTTTKDRGRKRTTAAARPVVALEAELAESKAAHARLIGVLNGLKLMLPKH